MYTDTALRLHIMYEYQKSFNSSNIDLISANLKPGLILMYTLNVYIDIHE